jgi:hypothetical protein
VPKELSGAGRSYEMAEGSSCTTALISSVTEGNISTPSCRRLKEEIKSVVSLLFAPQGPCSTVTGGGAEDIIRAEGIRYRCGGDPNVFKSFAWTASSSISKSCQLYAIRLCKSANGSH